MHLMQNEPIECGIDEEYRAFDPKAEIECICPKCRRRHTMQLYWTGVFTPRKYCKHCRNHAGEAW